MKYILILSWKQYINIEFVNIFLHFILITSYAPDYNVNVQYSSKLPLSVMALELNVIVVKLALEQALVSK
jgi:hypothetical protein